MRAAPKAVIASQSDAAGTTLDADLLAAAAGHRVARPRAVGDGDSAGRRRDLALVGAAAFDRCLRQPASYRSGPFALHLSWRSAATGEAPIAALWRLGLVIPKRHEASAVARNTIKRRWRAAFRRGRVAWASEFGSADLVVRMQSPLVKKPDAPRSRKKDAKDATTRAANDARLKPGSQQAATPTATTMPARVRARDAFAPDVVFGGFVERLRHRVSSDRVAGKRS